MTDKVNPTRDGDISSQQTAAVVRFGGGSTGWVVPAANDPANVATDDGDIDETALNAFAESHAGDSLDVTIDAGQAYVGGAWVARDLATTVTLDASTNGQVVSVGWDVDRTNTLIIGKSAEFDPEDPRIDLWAFDTDASGVTAATDRRNRDGYRIANDVVKALVNLGDQSFTGYPLDSDDLASDAITQTKIAADAVGSDEIANSSVGTGHLSFDTATQTELDNHAASSSVHHSRYADSEARSAIEAGDVDHVQFSNIEDISSGQIGRDNSIGFLAAWGNNGTAVLWDAYNVNAGNGVSISGGKGAESNPTLSVTEGDISHDKISGVSRDDHHTRGESTYYQTSEPNGSDGESWFNPDNGLYYVHDGSSWRPIPPAQTLDETTTFDGSDGETVSHSDTVADSGSVKLPTSDGTTTRDNDDNSTSTDNGAGLVINPNKDLVGVVVTISGNTGNPSDVYLAESDETILVNKSAGYTSGDTVTLEATLQSGTKYYVYTRNGGGSYTSGYNNTSFPFTGPDLDIVDGVWQAHPDDNAADEQGAAYSLDDVRAVEKSNGNVVVSWGSPQDIDSWDLATFERTLDSESVEVNVEDGNGNVLFSDIGRNFDISTVDPSKNVRFRVNLSRSNSSNNPSCDYVARRYVR